ncbi:MAG: protein kinase, partial [Xanthomonadales bacterium]|nr:protein kinase [Xanthomonadales bacterium]
MKDAVADHDRRLQALRLMRAALDVTAAARDAWVATQCGDDVALKHEVEQLLAADAVASGVLDQPLAAHVAGIEAGQDSRIGRRMGPYLLTDLIGRGGMGAVFRGEREEGGFRQSVAIKLLRTGDHEDPNAARRFERERQILVGLQHRNIARLLDGGVADDGQPWYAMELVEGEPLLAHVARTGASLPQ